MQSLNLTNHFLIAMPGLADPNFYKTVTYICAHNEDGAMGIVINRPLDLMLGDVFSQLSLEIHQDLIEAMPVYQGGPVQIDRGFVIHRQEGRLWNSSINVSNEIGITTSRDILEALAAGKGPEKSLFALGYAGWGAGQLESELKDNAWLSGPMNPDIIFNTPWANRWESAALLLGVDLDNLSSDIGHA